MMNPDVGGYTKTRNHRKILQQAQKNYWKPNEY